MAIFSSALDGARQMVMASSLRRLRAGAFDAVLLIWKKHTLDWRNRYNTGTQGLKRRRVARMRSHFLKWAGIARLVRALQPWHPGQQSERLCCVVLGWVSVAEMGSGSLLRSPLRVRSCRAEATRRGLQQKHLLEVQVFRAFQVVLMVVVVIGSGVRPDVAATLLAVGVVG